MTGSFQDRGDALAAAAPDPGDDRRGPGHHPQHPRAPGREIALIPTTFRQATWAPGERAGTVTATWHFGDDTETAELRVREDGQLLEVVLVDHWGHPVAIPRQTVVGHQPAG